MSDEDARLSDFASTSDDGTADDPASDDGAGPAVPTSAWRPGGVCAACGDPAERRWRDDGAFVCPDCKEW